MKKELVKNKIVALLLCILGIVSIPVTEDLTAFAFMFLISTALFVEKENVILI